MKKLEVVVSTVLTISEWTNRGEELAALYKRSCWDIADWLLAVPSTIGISAALDRAERLFGKRRETLQTYTSVGRAFPSSTRVEALTFAHHRAVLNAEPERHAELLAQAVSDQLSVKDLAERARPPVEKPVEVPAERFILDGLSSHEIVSIQSAAERAGTTVPAFVRELIRKQMAEVNKEYRAEVAAAAVIHTLTERKKKEAALPENIKALQREVIHAYTWKEREEVRRERLRRIAPRGASLHELFDRRTVKTFASPRPRPSPADLPPG